MNQNKPFAPMLASSLDDVDLNSLRYPFMVSPKLDGIRCIIENGVPMTRNKKPIRNKYVFEYLSGLPPLDGELVVGSATDAHCMNNTSSGIMSSAGQPDFHYHVFDRFDIQGEFTLRIAGAQGAVAGLNLDRVSLVGHDEVGSADDLLRYEAEVLQLGYEGVMLRAPLGPYKQGRSTPREQYLLKLKRFIEGEAVVFALEEAMENMNPLTKDELGRAKRTSHQENKEGKGMIGAIWARSEQYGEMKIAPGVMNHAARINNWSFQEQVIGKTVSWRAFGYGMKDLPRFPRFYGFREDL